MAELVQDGPWAGWIRWTDPVDETFLDVIGPSYSRPDGANRATVMVETRQVHRNRLNALHGGFLAAFADHTCFAAVNALGRTEQMNGVTVDLTLQFLDAGRVGPPLRAEVELLRETKRLMFMRATIYQEDRLVAASTATFRKAREAG